MGLGANSKILISGSRDWPYDNVISTTIASLPKTVTIIHGGCPTGADFMAAEAARRRGQKVIEVKADWSRGKRAGPERNGRMFDDHRIDLVLAFWYGASPGTRDAIRQAMKRGVPLRMEWRPRVAAD